MSTGVLASAWPAYCPCLSQSVMRMLSFNPCPLPLPVAEVMLIEANPPLRAACDPLTCLVDPPKARNSSNKVLSLAPSNPIAPPENVASGVHS